MITITRSLTGDGNVLNGSSPLKGPCLVFLVKFMEEILGFKTFLMVN